MEDIPLDQDKFDAVLKRMLNAKPISKAEISARINTEREAKKAASPSKRKIPLAGK